MWFSPHKIFLGWTYTASRAGYVLPKTSLPIAGWSLPSVGRVHLPQGRTHQFDRCTIWDSSKGMNDCVWPFLTHFSLMDSGDRKYTERETQFLWALSFPLNILPTCHTHAVGKFYLKHKSELVLRRKHQTFATLERKPQSYSIKGNKVPRHGITKGKSVFM